MKNHIYRIGLGGNNFKPDLEFYVCETNEINPSRDILEMGIVVIGKDMQLDGDLDESELDSLIDYLQDCQRYIKQFNKNSKTNQSEP